ncbi:MAG: hypothetical protein V4795_24140 [Pseudomonadota bacterium]
MWHVVVWALVAVLATPWTLACLALHWLLTGPDWSGGSVQVWMQWLEQWRIPVWLAEWLPMDGIGMLKAWLTTLGPWVESLLAQAPALLGWLVPLLWIGWILGLLVLVVLGAAGSVLVVALRRPPRAVAA